MALEKSEAENAYCTPALSSACDETTVTLTESEKANSTYCGAVNRVVGTEIGGGGVGRLAHILAKKRLLPQKKLYFETHITEHCNLQCARCAHFSPLAKETYLDVDLFENDCKRLSFLTKGVMRHITLLGGEPLLHPELTKFLAVAREYFPGPTIVSILTNGILLPEQPEHFWQCCCKYNAQIGISLYGIGLNIKKIKDTAAKYNVKCGYALDNVNIEPFDGTRLKSDKTCNMKHFPFDVNGGQDSNKSFEWCGFANSCVTLRDGRLYTCAPAAHSWIFNKYFGTDLQRTEDDSINIHTAKSQEDILDFLARPIPFCRYCNVAARTSGHQWKPSQKTLSEWT